MGSDGSLPFYNDVREISKSGTVCLLNNHECGETTSSSAGTQ